MKIFLPVLVLLGCASPASWAQSALGLGFEQPSQNTNAVQQSGGRSNANQFYLRNIYNLGNLENEGGMYVEVGWMTKLNDFISAGMGVGYSRLNTKGHMLSEGDLTMAPIVAKLRFSTPGRVQLFAEANGGYFVMDHSLSAATRSANSAQNWIVQENVPNTWGAYFIGGLTAALGQDFQFSVFTGERVLEPHVGFNAINYSNVMAGKNSVEYVNLNATLVGADAAWKF